MIWTREQLEALSEAEFRDRAVIPLFKAMGYQGVRSHHGGALEQGKDVVMWRVNDLGSRRNYAAVVKAERIGGSASTLAQTALTQVQEALGSSFLDEVTREEHLVHEVFLVNSADISTEALLSWKSVLGRGGAADRVSFIWGNSLWELLRKHLPKHLIFDSLMEAQRALASADSRHSYLIQVGPRAAQIVMLPQGPDSPPLEISLEPRFPDTDEGREQLRAFEDARRTGAPISVKADYLEVKGLPPSADLLRDAFVDGTIHLGTPVRSTVLVASLSLERPGVPAVVLLPHVEFGSGQAGTEEATLSNKQQLIPFKVSFTVRRGTRQGAFTCNFDAARASAVSHHRALLIQGELHRGGVLVYEDVITGIRTSVSELTGGAIEDPGAGYTELWGHLAEIQRKTGTIIPAPDREHFTAEDVDKTLTILEAITSGTLRVNKQAFVANMLATAVIELIAGHPDGVLGALRIEKSEHTETLLDVPVNLGPVRLQCQLARIPPEELQAVLQHAQRVSAGGADHFIRVPIESSEEAECLLVFERWAGIASPSE